jgi:hypothetical protein
MNKKLIISNKKFQTFVKAGKPSKEPNVVTVTTADLDAAFDEKLNELEESPRTLRKHNARIRPEDNYRDNFMYISINALCRFTNNCLVTYTIKLKKKPIEESDYVGKNMFTSN